MNFIKQMLFTIVLSLVLQYFLPWWTLAIGAAAGGYFSKNNGFAAFLAGAAGAAVLWVVAGLLSTMTADTALMLKMNRLLPMPALALAAIVAALVGGFAGMTGAFLRSK